MLHYPWLLHLTKSAPVLWVYSILYKLLPMADLFSFMWYIMVDSYLLCTLILLFRQWIFFASFCMTAETSFILFTRIGIMWYVHLPKFAFVRNYIMKCNMNSSQFMTLEKYVLCGFFRSSTFTFITCCTESLFLWRNHIKWPQTEQCNSGDASVRSDCLDFQVALICCVISLMIFTVLSLGR